MISIFYYGTKKYLRKSLKWFDKESSTLPLICDVDLYILNQRRYIAEMMSRSSLLFNIMHMDKVVGAKHCETNYVDDM